MESHGAEDMVSVLYKTTGGISSSRNSKNVPAMFAAFLKNLTPNQKAKMEKLIYRYRDVFASEKGLVGRTVVVTHNINIGDGKLIRQRLRRLQLNTEQCSQDMTP